MLISGVLQRIIKNGTTTMNLTDTQKQHVRNALNGDIYALLIAFDWASSPQGVDFWMRQYEDGQLTPDGRAALEAMLND